MKRVGLTSLLLLAISLAGCVIVPYGAPHRACIAPVAVVAPVPVVGFRTYR